MDNTLNNLENNNTNWNIGGFDINKKKSEITQELNIPNYKDGIDLIFEQNPELINIISNSLIWKNITSKVQLKNRFAHIYDIILNNEKIGKIELPLDLEWDTTSIGDIEIYENYRWKWLGIETYKAAMLLSPKPIESLLASQDANRVRESLVKQGLAEKTEFGYKTKKIINNFEKQTFKEIYAEYLTTIFPESKIRNIAYHGTSSTFEGEDFDKSKLWSSTDNITNKLWFYFVPDKIVSDIFIKWRKYKRENGKIKVILPENAKTLCVLLNVKNPEYIEGDIFQKYAEENKIPPLKLDGDSIVITPQTKNILPEFSCDNYVVFNSEQIHILGSEKDIKQLKEWLNSKK